jgi:hypothetical protein
VYKGAWTDSCVWPHLSDESYEHACAPRFSERAMFAARGCY